MLYCCSAVARLGPDDLKRWRQSLYEGDQLDASVVRRLIDEVEQLRAERAAARIEFARKAAAALEERLATVATYNRGGCSKCGDAEARAFLAKLKRVVGEEPEGPGNMR